MEETVHKPKHRSPAFYLLLAGFIAGSFAGAAFGVVFALSADTQKLFSSHPSRTQPQAPIAAGEDAEVIAAVKKVSPSVVSINVMKDVSQIYYNQTGPDWPFQDFFGFGFPQPRPQIQAPPSKQPAQKQVVGGGTGFVITPDGLILTNRHVVTDEEADYEVVMSDGKRYPAKVLARDSVLDLAVLKIEAKELPAVELGDSDAIQPGQTVIAIGNALAQFSNTITKGVISGKNRHVIAGNGGGSSEIIEEALQTDAAINPGNSGGPLISLDGRVVGMNTAVNQGAQSIGFAIPINAAKSVIASVKLHGKIVRPWLGVRYTIVDNGALIVHGANPKDVGVVPGSPADKAGIVEKDIILEIDGIKINQDHSLAAAVGRKTSGDIVIVKLLHEGKEKTLTVTLGELPATLK